MADAIVNYSPVARIVYRKLTTRYAEQRFGRPIFKYRRKSHVGLPELYHVIQISLFYQRLQMFTLRIRQPNW